MLRGRAVVGGLVLVILSGGAVGLSGCGKSGYQYVENEDLGVFARLPDDWAVYDEEDLLAAGGDAELSEEEAERRVGGTWFRGFDSSDDPSIEGVVSKLAGDTPHGFVRVEALPPNLAEQANRTMLRLLPTNAQIPISVTERTPGIQVVLDESVEFDGGFHGVHTVAAISPSELGIPLAETTDEDEDEEIAMVDQTVVLDPSGNTVYMFVVSCDRHCYLDTHDDVIQDLVESWTIQEDGR
jgi:hypothetical protein